MFKLIILTSDLSSTKKLVNQIIGDFSSLKIVGILTSNEEFELYKNKKNFDLILFHQYPTYKYFLNMDYNMIIISNFKMPMRKFGKKLALSTKLSFKELKNEIEIFTQRTSMNYIKEEISKILLDLGFNFKYIGTIYLIDTIAYYYTHYNDEGFENLEKNIFPYIAKLHHTKPVNVKWSISRTINLMYLNHTTKSISILEEYFYLEHLQKPTPKTVIGTITNKLFFNENSKQKTKIKHI